MIARFTAASMLIAAAFGAHVPGLDRAGFALIGLAFAVVSLGSLRARRPALEQPPEPVPLVGLEGGIADEVGDAMRRLEDVLAGRAGRD